MQNLCSRLPLILLFFLCFETDIFTNFHFQVNMSPNLSSAHFTQNQLLYEQVVYNIFNLIGVAGSMNHFTTLEVKEQEMLTSFKDLSVDPSRCHQLCQDGFV